MYLLRWVTAWEHGVLLAYFLLFRQFLKEICKIEVQPVSSPDPQGHSDPKVDKLEVDIEEKMVLPGHIDPEKQRFPYCIVWTPIPFLT